MADKTGSFVLPVRVCCLNSESGPILRREDKQIGFVSCSALTWRTFYRDSKIARHPFFVSLENKNTPSSFIIRLSLESIFFLIQ